MEKDKQIFLTTDAAITINNEKIVLIKRAKEPFMDKYVMPGGHVDFEDQSVVHACVRELEEEIGLVLDVEDLKFLTILDSPDRDPRPCKRISVVHYVNLDSEDDLRDCKAATDAASIHVLDLKSIMSEQVGFDHWLVVEMLLGLQK